MPMNWELGYLPRKEHAALARQIKERAGWKCEHCRAPHGQRVWRRHNSPEWISYYKLPSGYRPWYVVKICLTMAHLDHNPANNHPDNLAALCQGCHLRHDAKHNAAKARRTRQNKRYKLFLEAGNIEFPGLDEVLITIKDGHLIEGVFPQKAELQWE